MRAIWNEEVIAESDATEVVEGNHYFPRGAVHQEYLQESDHQTTCPWKGEASYFHLEVDGEVNENAAWYYPDPTEAARQIKDHIAFWKGVEVVQ